MNYQQTEESLVKAYNSKLSEWFASRTEETLINLVDSMCDLAVYLKENEKEEQALELYDSAQKLYDDNKKIVTSNLTNEFAEYWRVGSRILSGREILSLNKKRRKYRVFSDNPPMHEWGYLRYGNAYTLNGDSKEPSIDELREKYEELQHKHHNNNVSLFPNSRGAEKRLGPKKISPANPLYLHTRSVKKGGKKRSRNTRRRPA